MIADRRTGNEVTGKGGGKARGEGFVKLSEVGGSVKGGVPYI